MCDRIRCVIFDMDGVIFDTERFYLECSVPAAERLGLKGMAEVCYDCIGLTEEETEKRLLRAFGEEAPLEEFYKEISAVFRKRYEEEGLPVKDGVREILAWLRENKIPTALASSTKTEIVRMELHDAGLDKYFDLIIGGDMAGRSKPAPDIFLKTADLMGMDPADCIVIEDSFNGIRAASSAGMIPVMVPDLLQPDDEMRALAFRIEGSLKEVLDIFRSM